MLAEKNRDERAAFAVRLSHRGHKIVINLLARIGLTALLFSYVFPALFGATIHFTGSFWPDAVLYGAVFAGVCFLFDLVIAFAIDLFGFLTLGIGYVLAGLFLLFGFWLIPAIQLQVFAHYFPDVFSIADWGHAILAGFLIMYVNWLTKPTARKQSRPSQ